MNTEIRMTASKSLSPEGQRPLVYYEQPLSERIRALLRLEYLFAFVHHNINSESEWGSRVSLTGLIEINDLMSRFDLKAELIKELERHSQVLNSLRQHPNVDGTRLESATTAIGSVLTQLRSKECQPAQAIRKNELVYAVKQRLPIPGGTCNFDVPAYHHWLSRPAETRIEELHRWLQDLSIIQTGVARALGMIRDSTQPRSMRATAGFYQQPVDATVQCNLVRVGVAADLPVFPEISGGKHRFTIRFLEQPDTSQRPAQTTQNIDFELQCCNF